MNRIVKTLFATLTIITSANADILHVPQDYPDIQTAISAAQNGDKIMVRQDFVNLGFIDIQGLSVDIIGTGSGATLWQNTRAIKSVITIVDSPRVFIENFTIKSGVGNPSNDDRYGGGIYIESSNCTINRVLLTDNSADCGGALFIKDSEVIARNSVIYKNIAEVQGGAIYSDSSNIAIENCTIMKNTVNDGQAAGAFISNVLAQSKLTNNIFWDNSSIVSPIQDEIVFLSNDDKLSTLVNNNVIQGGGSFVGTNNVFSNPLLGENLIPIYGSPCIDAGSFQFAPDVLPYDFDGTERLINRLDIGAQEAQYPCFDLTNDGTVNIIDLQFILDWWGTANPIADVNNDGIVDLSDFKLVSRNFGDC